MEVDPRFSAARGEDEGRAILRFAAAEELEIREGATALATIGFDELCDLAGVEAAVRPGLRGPGALILANGWQSWSFGGELAAGEGPRRTLLIEGLNAHTSHPALRERPGLVDSHFLTWLRSGDSFLVLASLNARDRTLPPVSFRWRRGERSLAIAIYAEGARFAAGEAVAEICVFSAAGFFGAKDALGTAFRGRARPEAPRFLGERAGPAAEPGPGRGKPPRIGGYGSWYRHYAAIDEGKILGDLERLLSTENLAKACFVSRGRTAVFQIDDGWERAIGDWSPDPAKFPRGMAPLARGIEDRGLVPGIWLAPFLVERRAAAFAEKRDWLLRDARGRPVVAGWSPAWGGSYHCLDLSLPAVGDYLEGLVETLIEEWGFRYLKLDFLYAGLLRGARAGGGAAYAAYDRVMKRITSHSADTRGRPTAFLGCGAPFEPSFRHLPLMRVGADTREDWDWPLLRALRHQGRPSAYVSLTHAIGRTVLDGTVFANDPDVVFCRSRGCSLTGEEKELVAAAGFALGSQLMTSDAAPDSQADSELVRRLAALFGRLEGREFGALRVGRDVYELASRDGGIRGLANLSGRAWPIDPSRFDTRRALVCREAAGSGPDSPAVAPHTIALFEV